MDALSKTRGQKRQSIWSLVLGGLLQRTPLAFLAGAITVSLLRALGEVYKQIIKNRAESLWKRHVDLSVIQACVLSTEHLHSLGRVEKRTLFVKPISEVFRNEYIQARVLEAAQKAAASRDPVMVTHLSEEDKWHVLNMCTNHISSCFAPYHVFFNEARRTKSYYKSAWYCFTMTCAQTEACGRWFITPYKPVGAGDCGNLRIRIVLVNEQELREIAEGSLEAPPTGMFNGRHLSRWQTCQRFAALFARQLRRVTGSGSTQEDGGKSLCGRLKTKVSSQVCLGRGEADGSVPEYEPEDNSILRIHIPFPSSKDGPHFVLDDQKHSADMGPFESNVAKDVVLFE